MQKQRTKPKTKFKKKKIDKKRTEEKKLGNKRRQMSMVNTLYNIKTFPNTDELPMFLSLPQPSAMRICGIKELGRVTECF